LQAELHGKITDVLAMGERAAALAALPSGQ
jgi:hypothetical protein